MSRIIPPTGLREIEVETSRGKKVIRAGKDGLFDVQDPKLARQLKKEGLGEAGLNGFSTSGGYPCTSCGFGSWFKKCSRCGHENDRVEMDGTDASGN
jgi:hypothetical protein